MSYSDFGKKFTQSSGIVELMNDLGEALSINPDMLFLGGGNPAQIPAAQALFKAHLQSIVGQQSQIDRLLGNYQSPQGDPSVCDALASYLKRNLGWDVTRKNIAIANGSQSAFFIIANLLAGQRGDQETSIHLPVSPEYVGYADSGLSDNFFSASKPTIELLPNRMFKYHVDFDHLDIPMTAAALCISRPTNPTGNMLSDTEVEHLNALAEARGIPLIIDGAYGLPFPDIRFVPATAIWNNNIIMMLSLSKLGLPGVRGGIVIGNEEFISDFNAANTVISLASGTLGPMLLESMINNNDLDQLSNSVIQPYYQSSSEFIVAEIQREMSDLPVRIHKAEGAIFVWIWLQDLPITSHALYQRCKQRELLVVPGEHFFIGLSDQWSHKYECLRLSHAQPRSAISAGIKILAEEARAAYRDR